MSNTAHLRDLARVDITPKMIADALRMPTSFGLSSDAEHADEIGETWSLGPVIETRDSGLRERANRIALERYLESLPELADDWCVTHARHWACGWVDHLTYRVLDADGEPSRMMREVALWFAMLQEECVADSNILSEMEFEAESENWSGIMRDLRRAVVANAPHVERALDAMDDGALDVMLWALGIDGESDGEGWRRYSRWDIERLVEALDAATARAARSTQRRARRARKMRRGW